MQTQCMDTCKSLSSSHSHHRFLGFCAPNLNSSSTSLAFLSPGKPFLCVSYRFDPRTPDPTHLKHKESTAHGRGGLAASKSKDNVWSVDNELAEAERERESNRRRGRGRGRGRGRVKKVGKNRPAGGVGSVSVSGAMLMEVETVLQTQEPVIRPSWITFASSVSGIWKGVGAVFSPITAEMEPIEMGNNRENLYDCYTLSCIEAVSPSSGGQASHIHRKINWVTLNPYGEMLQQSQDNNRSKEENKKRDNGTRKNLSLPKFESFDFEASDLMEEDLMGNDPGLVFFEDGSYSRGPVNIPVGEADESKYYLSPTIKFEQCLVKGCHKRLRMVHTIEFSNGGADIQILRVALYEEQWVNAATASDDSDLELDLKPFSQGKRMQPSGLTGSWKVFEVSATPIYGETETAVTEESEGMPYVYLCTETLKKRSLPESQVYFKEEEVLDMQDATVLWLPGGVTGYVDVKAEGVLCIGVGWYSDEGINLVMERDYGLDGKLKEVRSKTEVKRRWSEPLSV